MHELIIIALCALDIILILIIRDIKRKHAEQIAIWTRKVEDILIRNRSLLSENERLLGGWQKANVNNVSTSSTFRRCRPGFEAEGIVDSVFYINDIGVVFRRIGFVAFNLLEVKVKK